jgi:hypothetical protein
MREQAYESSTHKWFELENAMEDKLSGHVATEMEALQTTVDQLRDTATQSKSNWHLPFAILSLVVILAMYGMWLKYQKLLRGHLL